MFTYSSNIGAAIMARSLGVTAHQAFLRKLGQLDKLWTELPESREPMLPKRWGELNTVTISYGHGLSVAPLQAVMGVGALMNGGLLIPPTFLRRSEADARAMAKQVIKPETSVKMRYLMRLNAEKGTATKADVKGYYVGAKTGTAEKVVGGRYSKTKLLTDVMAVLPADDPKYLVLVVLDRPQIARRRMVSPPRAGTRSRPPPRSSPRLRRCSTSSRATTSTAGRPADPRVDQAHRDQRARRTGLRFADKDTRRLWMTRFSSWKKCSTPARSGPIPGRERFCNGLHDL